MGVVTGIVKEFQFGMNWSEYSRFVGDIFGAPLALEALLAFFMESTFIGLWIFGWDRLSKGVHLATIYLTAIGTMVSAVFILAANSWMQNPVGATFNPQTGRAELTDFGAVLGNPVFLTTFLHTIATSYMIGGALIAGISFWHLSKVARGRHTSEISDASEVEDVSTWRWATKFGAWVLIAAAAITAVSGDIQGKEMTKLQPMKMAAAEAAWESTSDFSVITFDTGDGTEEIGGIKIPGMLGFLANNEWGSQIQGVNDLRKHDVNAYTYTHNDGSQTELQASYASVLREKVDANNIDLAPSVGLSYWSFRLMIGLGMAGALIGLIMLIELRGGRNPRQTGWHNFWTFVTPFLPLIGISFGWIFTEMGRQPWIVTGVLPTASAVSPGVSAGSVLFSTIAYTVVYGALAVVELFLFLKTMRAGLPDVSTTDNAADGDAPLSFAY